MKLAAGVAAAIVLSAAEGATAAVSFELQLANPASSIFRLRNTSPSAARITAMSATVGDTGWNFDLVNNIGAMVDSGEPLLWDLVTGDTAQGGVRTDAVGFAFTGFEPGDRFAFAADLDPDSGDGPSDLRQVYFNNGPAPNSVVTVRFTEGGLHGGLRLELPDADLGADPQSFDYAGRLEHTTAVAFDLEIANPGVGIFRIRNSAPDAETRITGLHATIGDTAWNYDVVTSLGALEDAGDPLIATLVAGDTAQGGARSDEVAFALTGFEAGDRFTFTPDLDPDSIDGPSDFRTILFNNGPAANAVVSMDFLLGDVVGVLAFELPDVDLLPDPQVVRWDVHGLLAPEPSAAMLLLTGAGAVLVRGRRCRPGSRGVFGLIPRFPGVLMGTRIACDPRRRCQARCQPGLMFVVRDAPDLERLR